MKSYESKPKKELLSIINTLQCRISELENTSKSTDGLSDSDKSAHLLKSIIESPESIVIFALDLDYCYTAFNTLHKQTMKNIWGADIDIGLNMLDMINDPKDRKRAKQNFDRALGGERFTLLEKYGEPPNRFYYENKYDPIFDEDNKVTGLSLFLTDVTEKITNEQDLKDYRNRLEKMVEERTEKLRLAIKNLNEEIKARVKIENSLKESQKRFADLFNAGDDTIIVHIPPSKTQHGQVIEVNDIACHRLGYSRQEFLSLNLAVITSAKPDFIRGILKKLSIVGVANYESILFTKNGDEIPVEINCKLFQLNGQKAIISIARDITERKQAEQEKIDLEKQMLQAQKLESLGVLAGGIAHDFNNILTGILGNVELAKANLRPYSPADEYIDGIHTSSERAAELVKQMLAYSGKGKFSLEPIDLNILIEETVDMLQVSVSKKAVLKFNYDKNTNPTEGDPSQIRQIIMNLVINGSEAIEKKSGVVAISTGTMYCDRDYIDSTNISASIEVHGKSVGEGMFSFIEVADTGTGMSKETIDKIFDPFFTTKFTGRGLGLAAVLGIIRGHKGLIKIYSEESKGTTFKVLFPVSDCKEEIKRPDQKIKQLAKNLQFTGKFLVADDEESVRTVTKHMLEKLGFTVILANDGREAVDIFKRRKDIVAVLLDLTMPHLDGAQVFQKIRKINPGIKVILASGYNQEEATQKFIGKGLAGFIQKPFGLTALTERVKKIFTEDAI